MTRSAFAFLVVLFPLAASAQDALRLDIVPPPAPPPAKPFAAGTKTLQFEGSYIAPIRYSDDDLATGSIGVGYYLFDNHSVTLLAQGFHVNQEPGESACGGDLFVLGRSHLFTRDRFSLFIDGGGYSWANNAVPLGGTTYNFMARIGGGVAYRIEDNCYLTAGARYFHLSNGQQHGRERNPAYDGVEYYVGMLFTFR